MKPVKGRYLHKDSTFENVSIARREIPVLDDSLNSVNLLPPAMKLRVGNVFTPVCDSVHWGGGGSLWGSLSRGSLSMGVSVHRVSVQGVSVQGISIQGGLCPGRGSLSVSLWGSLSRGYLSSESLSRGSLSRGLCPRRGVPVREIPRTVTCGWYASYWNAFLLKVILENLY